MWKQDAKSKLRELVKEEDREVDSLVNEEQITDIYALVEEEQEWLR